MQSLQMYGQHGNNYLVKIIFHFVQFLFINQMMNWLCNFSCKELAQIVQQIKSITGQNKVNIAVHSKGGLDARVYLADTNTQDVANLVMIGYS